MSARKASIRATVLDEIKRGNPWYLESQFAWAAQPFIQRIYEDRYRYISACVERMRQLKPGVLRLLDAGCGDGYWLVRLGVIPGLILTGVDYNPVRVERARTVAPNATVKNVDLEALKSEDRFDIILFSQVIEHVQQDVELLRMLRTLLNPGGVLILGAPNEGSFLHQRHIARIKRKRQTDHVHFYTEEELRAKLRSASFSVESVMREAFFIGNERVFYWLAARRAGYAILKGMTAVWPRECSDYYFECRRVD